MRTLIIVYAVFLLPCLSQAQVYPREGSKLNYRIIGFSFPADTHAREYKVEIAKGNIKSIDSFKSNIIQSSISDSNKLIAEVPAFGKEYTWRVLYTRKKEIVKAVPLYHFSTMMNNHVDTFLLRLRVLHPAEAHQDDYVSVDAGGVLYDMKGNPVWFVPDTDGIDGNVLNMKFTSQGTVTFLYKEAYEMNYDGHILWKSPNKGIVSGDRVTGEFYHHEFTRLPNGHYMVLGMQALVCKLVTSKDTSYIVFPDDQDRSKVGRDGYYLGKFGTMIEYDEQGNIVWSWQFSKHIQGSDFAYYESRVDSNKRFDPHDNAFYFDEKNKCIYLGSRNLNRIIKIDYPSGKVLAVYGENFKPGAKSIGAGLFCNQHSISRSQEGYLYIFDNNSCCNRDSLPSIVMLKEPVAPSDTFTKVWEYKCTVEGDYSRNFGSGGNAIELADRSMFICMGSEYSKMLIVNRAKKILWSALPENLMMPDDKWVPIKEFRGYIITREDLENMIWKSEAFELAHGNG